MSLPVLETVGLSKHFGEVKAVSDLSIKLYPGRVHTILGENGCGKSTTLKMLAGIHFPTRGKILRDAQEVNFKSPIESRNCGIAIIFQELSLCNNLTVAQNIYANIEPNRFGVINDSLITEMAAKLLGRYHIPISPHLKVGSLSMAQRQLVEIAKGLSYPSQVLILDEPTSSLSDSEAEILFRIIKELKLDGKAIVYVSHKMAEIMRISDDITVMRDGQHISTVRKEEVSIKELIAMMVGREMNDIYPPKNVPSSVARTDNVADGASINVCSITNSGCFKDVSFDVYPGEIVGFFGLVGAGRSEVMKAIFGILPYKGRIFIKHQEVKVDSPRIAINNGIAFVTENRKEEGLILDHSVQINCNLVSFQHLARKGVLNFNAEQKVAENSIQKMNIKVHDRAQCVGSLSGGNQQKLVLAKWLESRPDILILDEPTRGVDVGAKFEIYKIIRDLAATGTAVIMVSSELPEVLSMSDRLFVMRDGELVKEFDTQGLSQDQVMVFATGVPQTGVPQNA